MNDRTSSSPRPTASLVIAVYNQADFLRRILLSCERQSERAFEVVVADDGSGPAVADTVRRFSGRFGFPIKHVWHEDQGFRKTIIVNRAAVEASSEYLIFIDGDCILHRHFVRSHLRHASAGVVLAGRRVCFNRELTERLSDEDVCSGRFERPTFWWRSVEHAIERRHGVYMPASYALENAFRKSAVTIRGCNFSMCKAEFLSVNGYDQSIVGRGLEDINLQARFDLKGLACKTIVREALQFHLHHAFDPVPHSAEKSREFCRPTSSWAASGIQSRA